MKTLILILLMPLLALAQPDTNRAYVTAKKPLTAIRFSSKGFVITTHEKSKDPKSARPAIEAVDSGTYFVRFGIVILKSKRIRILTYNKSNLYRPIGHKKLASAEASLYPTVKEWERLEWIRKNYELFMKQSHDYVKAKMDAYIRRACPEYAILVDSSYCGPGDYNTYVNGKKIPFEGDTTGKPLYLLNTVAHESTHRYNKLSWSHDDPEHIEDTKWQTWHRYMITPGNDVWARHTKMYNSAEFIAIVPKDAPSRIFRYDMYVSKKSPYSSNVHGIYGLMDEFSAYFNGTRADWLAYQTAKAKGNKDEMAAHERGCYGTYYAWYEFRLFIGWYLTWAKQKHPDVYAETMANKELARAFTEIDEQYGELVRNIEKTFLGRTIEIYDEDYAGYAKSLMKTVEPVLTEFKTKKPEDKKPEPKKKKKKK